MIRVVRESVVYFMAGGSLRNSVKKTAVGIHDEGVEEILQCLIHGRVQKFLLKSESSNISGMVSTDFRDEVNERRTAAEPRRTQQRAWRGSGRNSGPGRESDLQHPSLAKGIRKFCKHAGKGQLEKERTGRTSCIAERRNQPTQAVHCALPNSRIALVRAIRLERQANQ